MGPLCPEQNHPSLKEKGATGTTPWGGSHVKREGKEHMHEITSQKKTQNGLERRRSTEGTRKAKSGRQQKDKTKKVNEWI